MKETPIRLRWVILAYLSIALTSGMLFYSVRHTPLRRHTTLHWNPSATPLVQYNIYRSTDSNAFEKIGVSPYPDFEDDAITPGHVYRYYTRAEDAAGHESAPSNTVSVTN